MKKTIYIVKYEYYQYNSGQADNGTYWRKVELENFDKAQALYQKFKDAIDDKLSDEEKKDLVDDYIPYAGYFTDVKLFKSIVEEMNLEKELILNNSFVNCPDCYSEEEGYSLGCKSCSDSGERAVTIESINLALSAKQWLNNKVSELWAKYDRIFGLKYSLSNWSIYGNTLHITAGYSCRGTVFEEDFELEASWLWSSDIEKILLELKNKQVKEKEAEKRIENLEKLKELKSKVSELESKVNQ